MVIKIGDIEIGGENPTFIIAELSANHLQDFGIAVESLKAIKESGADAVKTQTYTADTITINSDKDYFRIKHGTIWDNNTFYDVYKSAAMPWEWQPKLKKLAEKLGLIFFSTPTDRTSVDFLEKLEIPAYKIASPEITDINLIEYVASKGKPIIISTGVAKMCDIEEAIDTCIKVGNDKVALLKCTSEYPSPLESLNLKNIPILAKTFNKVIGLSDHTLEVSIPIVSIGLGAKIVEKHFILDRKLGGPDAKFSLEPDEFKNMADAIRNVEKALGESEYKVTNEMKKNRVFLRSLFVVKDIDREELFTEENVRSIRPNYGIHPKYLKIIIGKKSRVDIERGTPLTWDMIA